MRSGLAKAPPEIYLLADETNGPSKKRWLLWLAVVLFSLLLHFIFFELIPNIHLPQSNNPVEVQQLKPEDLSRIKKAWKRQQSLLIDKDNRPAAKEAPKDARYFSDKNIQVEKEQRAKNPVLVPKPGVNSPAQTAQTPSAPAKKSESKSTRTLPNIGTLGIPFKIGDKKPVNPNMVAKEARPRAASNPSPPGGEQQIFDKQLPEGSEDMLNAQESVFYSFYARISENIAPLWNSQVLEIVWNRFIPEGEYVTVVDVACDEEGNLKAINYVERSGVRELDDAVDRSWKKFGKFPNPPRGLLDEHQEVHILYRFIVPVQGNRFMVRPPERAS